MQRKPTGGRPRSRGWMALAWVAVAMAVSNVVAVVWRVFHSDYSALLTAPISLLFWYWIGVGALRRTELHAHRPTADG